MNEFLKSKLKTTRQTIQTDSGLITAIHFVQQNNFNASQNSESCFETFCHFINLKLEIRQLHRGNLTLNI